MPRNHVSDHFRVPVPRAGVRPLQDALSKAAKVYGIQLVMVNSGNLLHVSISGQPDMVKLYAESVYLAQSSANRG